MAMFRSDKDLPSGMLPSQPSTQISGFNGSTNFYGQAGNLSLQHRAIGTNHIRGGSSSTGHITPTSITPGFPLGLHQQQQPQQQQQQLQQQQQQHSPNSLAAIGSRNVLGVQSQAGQQQQQQQQQSLVNMQKRPYSTSGPMPNFATSYGFGGSGSIDSHPTIDLSDFPTLSSRSSATPNPTPSSRTYVGMVSKPPQDSAPEFNISQEEFPALPGSQNPPVQSGESNGAVNVDQSKDGLKGDGRNQLPQKRGVQIHPDGTISNIPSGMVMDQFGIVGLVAFIRSGNQHPNSPMLALAPGIDLTTLGLNINFIDNLYSTFQSPFADTACRPQDIDYHVPAEYLTNMFIRDKLAPIKLNRYSEELLFFLFYMYGGDVLQLAAAAELYNRDWRYHKEERFWLTRAPQFEALHKTSTSEKGTYYVFDVYMWRKVKQDLHLEYEKLEDRPAMPNYSFSQMGNMSH